MELKDITILPNFLLKITEDIPSALILSRLLFWTFRTKDKDMWIYKSYKDWEKELYMSRFVSAKATKHLVDKGFISILRKKPGTRDVSVTHYKVNLKNICECGKLYIPMLRNLAEQCKETEHLITNIYKYIYIPNIQNNSTSTIIKNKQSCCFKKQQLFSASADVPLQTDTNTDNQPVTNEELEYENLCHNINEIQNVWNKSCAGLKYFKPINNLNNKISTRKDNKYVPLTVKEVIIEALTKYSKDDIITAITNYFNIYKDIHYFYDHKWTLGRFIFAGLHNHSGMYHFLSEEKYSIFKQTEDDILFRSLRLEFTPLCVTFDRSKLLDLDRNTYFGFPLEEVKTALNNSLPDIKRWMEKTNPKDFRFGQFYELERVIAAFFFTRKHHPQYDEMKKMLDIWKDICYHFTESAEKFKRDNW